MVHNLLVGDDVWDLLLDSKDLSECLNVEKRRFMRIYTVRGRQIEKMLVVDGYV